MIEGFIEKKDKKNHYPSSLKKNFNTYLFKLILFTSLGLLPSSCKNNEINHQQTLEKINKENYSPIEATRILIKDNQIKSSFDSLYSDHRDSVACMNQLLRENDIWLNIEKEVLGGKTLIHIEKTKQYSIDQSSHINTLFPSLSSRSFKVHYINDSSFQANAFTYYLSELKQREIFINRYQFQLSEKKMESYFPKRPKTNNEKAVVEDEITGLILQSEYMEEIQTIRFKMNNAVLPNLSRLGIISDAIAIKNDIRQIARIVESYCFQIYLLAKKGMNVLTNRQKLLFQNISREYSASIFLVRYIISQQDTNDFNDFKNLNLLLHFHRMLKEIKEKGIFQSHISSKIYDSKSISPQIAFQNEIRIITMKICNLFEKNKLSDCFQEIIWETALRLVEELQEAKNQNDTEKNINK